MILGGIFSFSNIWKIKNFQMLKKLKTLYRINTKCTLSLSENIWKNKLRKKKKKLICSSCHTWLVFVEGDTKVILHLLVGFDRRGIGI